jgi:uncharacterized protein YbaR (Trm112 family)
MHTSTLDILRCPYCGGQLEIVTSIFHRIQGDELHDGMLGCYCCIHPVVAGIPVMHLKDVAGRARAHIEAGEPDLARRAMFDIPDTRIRDRFDEVASSPRATYREAIEALGPDSEFRYFLFRFSDPSYRVAHALVRAVAGTVLAAGGRAIDICGGSGHLTRALAESSSPAPVLADLFFLKMWLARRFVAPGCEAVCCDANAALPFARGTFQYAMCADAFMFIWMKRALVSEMERLVDQNGPAAVVISHAHNLRVWSHSHGQPLPAEGYRDLFERLQPRVFAERGLFADVVNDSRIDLSRVDSAAALDEDPALAVIAASHGGGVFRSHAVSQNAAARGEFRVNPLYVVEPSNDRVRLRLQFPAADYEDEFGACREYLPEETLIDRTAFEGLGGQALPAGLTELYRRCAILDLPSRYY